ncbi:MAG TPA: DUF1488 family protein [Acetobacteraceae bacterium]
MSFEIEADGQRVACAISRDTLERAGPGHHAQAWRLRDTFERLRPRLEDIARECFRAEPHPHGGVVVVSSDDLNHPTPAAPAIALRTGT